jgi:hypothetical protein
MVNLPGAKPVRKDDPLAFPPLLTFLGETIE